ncbi:DNA-directed DNA polymerase alpha subunit pol12 [Microbotryomycetes sp. JL201]|nr:DNA-directed DNA polymerase alpha subunit pol12 [Microbotryomycetes sp. JL201]
MNTFARNSTNTNGGGGGGFAVDSLFQDAAATPIKRARTTGPASAKQLPWSSSPSQVPLATPRSINGAPRPSILNNSSPAAKAIGSFLLKPPSSSPVTPAVPFRSRPNKLQVQETLNGHLALQTATQKQGDRQRISLSSTMDSNKYKYRIAFEKRLERSEALDKAIEQAARVFGEHYEIQEFGCPTQQTQDDVIVVGRLCPETDNAKMTKTSTWIEPPRSLAEGGAGSRALLKFEADMKTRGVPSGSGGIGLFPGCLVALKGRNGGGQLFSVSEILMLPPIDPTYSEAQAILDKQHGEGPKKLGGSPMSVIVAAGPFTVQSDLEYAPLGALLDAAETEKPDVLVLIGPFIDADHPLIKSGNVDRMPEDVFKTEITTRVLNFLNGSPRSVVILVPHGRDLTNTHVAYPQSPFAKGSFGLPGKGVYMLPNPTTFSINEVVFGITSVDSLFALRNQEFFCPCGEAVQTEQEPDANTKDVMSRTCRHLLRQRSFYPIFPTPLNATGLDNVNLDVTHSELLSMGDNGADVVILPSRLKHFAKIVDSTVMVNPAFLTKGDGAGTFAKLTIHPIAKTELEQRIAEAEQSGDEYASLMEHEVHSRCRVDLIKV